MGIRKLLAKSAIGRLLSKGAERRRSPRMQPAGLVAYYWTGGIPRPNPVFEIGPHGAHIVAPAAFYLGTVVEIVFEDRADDLNNAVESHHICLYGRVLRAVADGFCVEFVFEDDSQRRKFQQFLNGLKRRNEDETNTGKTAIVQPPGTD
jgi:hypothetical protein